MPGPKPRGKPKEVQRKPKEAKRKPKVAPKKRPTVRKCTNGCPGGQRYDTLFKSMERGGGCDGGRCYSSSSCSSSCSCCTSSYDSDSYSSDEPCCGRSGKCCR